MRHRNSEPTARRHTFPAWLWFAAWSALIVAATVPGKDFVGHTHWQKVQWIPFRSPPVKGFDVAANVLLYLPLGYTLLRALPRPRIWYAVAFASLLSVALEWSQLYSHWRFPSAQDVVCNVFGAWVGAWLATRRRFGTYLSTTTRTGFV